MTKNEVGVGQFIPQHIDTADCALWHGFRVLQHNKFFFAYHFRHSSVVKITFTDIILIIIVPVSFPNRSDHLGLRTLCIEDSHVSYHDILRFDLANDHLHQVLST